MVRALLILERVGPFVNEGGGAAETGTVEVERCKGNAKLYLGCEVQQD